MPHIGRIAPNLTLVLFAIMLVACEHWQSESSEEALYVASFSSPFRVVMMRGVAPDPFVEGNSLDGFEAALAQNIEYVEADFVLTKDGVLVASHNLQMGGNCGHVQQKTLAELKECRLNGDRRVATLPELLAMPFKEVYIDLKESSLNDEARLLAAVKQAIADIEAADRKSSAVLMLYRVTEAVKEEIAAASVRAGTKGYPKTPEEVRDLIDLAVTHGFEMMCVNASALDAALVAYATERDVWLLPWDHARAANIPHWQTLAQAGIGGMIVTDYKMIATHVVPHSDQIPAVLTARAP